MPAYAVSGLSIGTPRFPPDVAASLQAPEGSVSFRVTLAERFLDAPPPTRTSLMETPYEAVLCSLELDTDGSLRFVRTGAADEPVRVLRLDRSSLAGARHLDVSVNWSATELTAIVSDRDDPAGGSTQATLRS
jgi:hypothetical protein